MSEAIKHSWKKDGQKVTVISTGPMTNIALFVSVYPELLDAIDAFVFMGGGVGLGNRSAVAGLHQPLYTRNRLTLCRVQYLMRSCVLPAIAPLPL
jgi:hypothetical protein